MEEEKKSTFKGPTFCPLKRPQDVIFIFLHCTNTFFRLIPSLTHPLISSQNSIYIHISIAINSSTIAHSYQTKTCLLKFKMVLPPHHNNHWVAMSHKSGETGTPLDSTWGIRVPLRIGFLFFFFFLYGIPLAFAWHSLTSRRYTRMAPPPKGLVSGDPPCSS